MRKSLTGDSLIQMEKASPLREAGDRGDHTITHQGCPDPLILPYLGRQSAEQPSSPCTPHFRQGEFEGGTLTESAFHPDIACMSFDRLFD